MIMRAILLLLVLTLTATLRGADAPTPPPPGGLWSSPATYSHLYLDVNNGLADLSFSIPKTAVWVGFEISSAKNGQFQLVDYGSEGAVRGTIEDGRMNFTTEGIPHATDDQRLDFKLSLDARLIPGLVDNSLLKVIPVYKQDGATHRGDPRVYHVSHWESYWGGVAMPIVTRGKDPVSGEKSWNTGFAGGVDYRIRMAPDAGYGVLNFLSIQIGLHGALLNQSSDDALELGMGVHVSLFQDVVAIGRGYNISTDEWYTFLGINLITGAQQIQSKMNK